MKNHEYIRGLSVEELAKLLVQEREIDEGEEDTDGIWQSHYWTYYVAANGEMCNTFSDALEVTINWLNADREEK